MNMKRALSTVAAAALCMGAFTGCMGDSAAPSAGQSAEQSNLGTAGSASTAAIPIKIANFFADNHPANIALNEVFKPMIEEKTGGRYVVEVYGNNTLGAEKEFMEAVKLGTVEMALGGSILSEQFPKLKVVEFPWVFDDLQGAYNVLNDPEVSAEIFEGFDKVGLVGRGFFVNGVRAISNSKRPINSLEDCQGLKMRMPEVQHMVDGGKALGFSVVTMSMSEIFTALQQGVIDGQENAPTTLLTSGWYEVQEHLALVNHQISFNWMCISSKFYDSLSAGDQAILDAACAAYCDAELALYMEAEAQDIKTLEDKGVKVTYPDREPFKAAGESVITDYCEKFPEFDAILNTIHEKEAELA